MASIDLHLHEVEDGWMPPICACCGRKGKYVRVKQVTWSPWWVPLVILLTGFLLLLPFVRWLFLGTILGPDANRRVTLHLPFCKRHHNHWRWRAWLLIPLLGLSLGLIAGGIFGLVAAPAPREMTIAWLLMAAGGVLGLVVWRVLAMILSMTGIHIHGLTGTAFTLVGVDRAFCDAVDKRRLRKPKSGEAFEMSAYDDLLRRCREGHFD
jgi:hypothetical protein